MDKIVAVVPIKLNNERLQGKNTKSFTNGEPLIHYILDTLQEVTGVDEIYVYCSNPKIKEYLPTGVHYLRRSETLDSKDTLILDVLQSFAHDIDAKYYVLAHATAPFLRSETIQLALDHVKSEEYDSALTVTELREFLWQDEKPLNFSQNVVIKTQDLQPIYAETTGLYIYSRELILKENRRTGDRPYLAKVDKIEAMDINEGIDFEIADAIFKDRQRNQLIQIISENRGEAYE